MKTRVRFLLPALLVSGSGICGAQETYQDTVRMCTSGALFTHVSVNDAIVAMDLWTKKLAARAPELPEMQLVVIDHVDEIVDALRQREIDIVALTSLAYLEMRDQVALEPLIVPGLRGRNDVLQEFVLVGRRADNDRGQLEDLRGKRLLAAGIDNGDLGTMWLDVLLMERGLATVEQFFGSAERRGPPAQALLPVFFGTADACVISRQALETMTELNPQLARDLTVLAASPRLLQRLMCVRADLEPLLLLEQVLNVHNEPEGRQLMALLRAGRAIRFEADQLAGVAALVQEHRALSEQIASSL